MVAVVTVAAVKRLERGRLLSLVVVRHWQRRQRPVGRRPREREPLPVRTTTFDFWIDCFRRSRGVVTARERAFQGFNMGFNRLSTRPRRTRVSIIQHSSHNIVLSIN